MFPDAELPPGVRQPEGLSECAKQGLAHKVYKVPPWGRGGGEG